jgi:lactate dehydrogenase-like 2-hydroxyacid dehydrogenase
MNRPRLLITRRLAAPVMQAACRSFDVLTWDVDAPIGAALSTHAEGCDAVLVMANDRLDASTVRALAGRGVRAIGTYSVGYEHIDLAAASACGLPVFHTPDALSDAVAEIALFLILAAARGTTAHEATLRLGRWGPWSPTQFIGRQLTGLRLGIFGLGRIGLAIARRAEPFGMAVHYHNRTPRADARGYTYHDTLASLLRVSDVLCVAAPSTPETRGVLDRQRLALLPPRAIFVNIARGDLVDETALIEAVHAGHIEAAGLDVYRNEPTIDPRLLALPRTTLLPHIGSATEQARLRMGEVVLEALAAWLTCGIVHDNCLNPAAARS